MVVTEYNEKLTFRNYKIFLYFLLVYSHGNLEFLLLNSRTAVGFSLQPEDWERSRLPGFKASGKRVF
jgi:hypothetical protein